MTDRVLYFDIQVPRPERDAASVRTWQMLAMLRSRGFEVDLAPLLAAADETLPGSVADLGVGLLPPRDETAWHGFFAEAAPSYGMMILCWSAVARRFMATARASAPAAALLYDTGDVNHVREYREAKATGNAVTLRRALATRAAEAEAMGIADATIAITDADAATLRALRPGATVGTVTMWVDPVGRLLPPEAGPPTITFVGRYGAPANRDAAIHLAQDVLPLVHERHPDAVLLLAGSEPDAAISALAAPRVEVPGWLPDLGPVFARSTVFAAPLRFGSGLKGKLLQAMGHGVPVVASGVAAEGLGATDGRELLLAETPTAIADAICRILADAELGRGLAAHAETLLATRFGRRAVEMQFDGLLSSLPRGAAGRV